MGSDQPPATTSLSLDAYGTYRPGGIIDAVVDRLEREKIPYKNVQLRRDVFVIEYPVSTQPTVDDEVQRQVATRVAQFARRLEQVVSFSLDELGVPQDLYIIAPMMEALCESLDLPHDLCTNCACTFPARTLNDEGLCLICIKET